MWEVLANRMRTSARNLNGLSSVCAPVLPASLGGRLVCLLIPPILEHDDAEKDVYTQPRRGLRGCRRGPPAS
ncbi:hypothetical protein BD309DRAFT_955342 [Dichomitus squalens]|nr:hypothetical protein BD309DRAFT_955342 [Dichomitus squalens]